MVPGALRPDAACLGAGVADGAFKPEGAGGEVAEGWGAAAADTFSVPKNDHSFVKALILWNHR